MPKKKTKSTAAPVVAGPVGSTTGALLEPKPKTETKPKPKPKPVKGVRYFYVCPLCKQDVAVTVDANAQDHVMIGHDVGFGPQQYKPCGHRVALSRIKGIAIKSVDITE